MPQAAASIEGLVPAKSRFAPGEQVRLLAEVVGAEAGEANLELEISHLGQVVHTATERTRVEPGRPARVTLDWEAPPEDFRGYLAVLRVPDSRSLTTAIDVSSTATRYPRYGFVSELGPRSAAESRQIVQRLAREYHLNMLQFYDWFWRHENLLKRSDGRLADSWQDLFGRTISVDTLRSSISAAHDAGTLAMAYVAVYAAREGYEQVSDVSPGSGLFRTPRAEQQYELRLGASSLFLFNPGDPAWQKHMTQEYSAALDELDFDGVQLDQFGVLPELYDSQGNPVDVAATFPEFATATRERLEHDHSERAICAFNIVDGSPGGWGAEPIAHSAPCQVLYSELWGTTDTYEDVRLYTEYLKRASDGKPVVLAGYAQYAEDTGPVREAERADRLEGVTTSSEHAGYTGDGYVDGFDQVGDLVSWDVDASEAQDVTLKLRYANGTDTLATRSVRVDDRLVGRLDLVPLGGWESWSEDPFVRAHLEPGLHTITVSREADDVGAINLDHLRFSEFSRAAIRLQNAAMFASGAFSIQLGDDVEAISHEYFPNRSKGVSPALARTLRAYYDFAAAYEELLFAAALVPLHDEQHRVELPAGPRSLRTGSDGIWTLLRGAPEHDVVHLINLVGVPDDLWRNAAPAPETQEELRVRYFTPDAERIDSIRAASPDIDGGISQSLKFSKGSSEGEPYVEVVVPRLEYWTVLFLHRSG